MNRPTAIALTGAAHVGTMLCSALVLCAAVEAVNWFGMWLQAKREGV